VSFTSDRFTPEERVLGTHSIGGHSNPRTGLDESREKNLASVEKDYKIGLSYFKFNKIEHCTYQTAENKVHKAILRGESYSQM
jgi:hypothetical protein